jgi:hypothetical protein
MADGSEPIVLRPITATSIAYVVVGILFLAFGLVIVIGVLSLDFSGIPGGAASSLPFTLPLGVPIAGCGVILLFRGPAQKVVLTDEDATVHNVFYTRRIPRNLVTGMGYRLTTFRAPYPGIAWDDPTKKQRKHPRTPKKHLTVVNFLSSAAVRTKLQDQADNQTDRLKIWCEAGQPSHKLRSRPATDKPTWLGTV